MTDAHPARSTEFLSRLHDGELGPAEDAAFASHRAACAECRRAADAFEATLAAFRAEPTAPAAPDLSARILRKIRARTPSRRPFGVTFGIDVRWAGVLVAALLVVLLSAPLLLRREPLVPSKPAAISAHLDEDTPAPLADAPENVPERRRQGAAPKPAPAAPPALAKDEASARVAPAPSSSSAPGADAPAEERRLEDLAAPPLRAKAAAPKTSAEPPRILVLADDDGGTPPSFVTRLDAPRLSSLRGREFVLRVEASGRVGAVLTAEGSAPAGPEADVLRSLVFSPGERPRRLRAIIE